ncbi:MAG: hypothetical protein U1F66_05715 [bacterium]
MNASFHKQYLAVALAAAISWICGCSNGGPEDDIGGGGGGLCPATNLGLQVCDPGKTTFSLQIDNGFFPLVVNTKSVLETPDGVSRVEIAVLNETEAVGGVTTRVVQETHSESGVIVEISRNFFAQAADGTVCYFGEAVDNIENGQVINHNGSWRADASGNAPGIIMPAKPSLGDIYSQEQAPGVAEDQATIQSLGDSIQVPAGSFTDTVTTEDCNRLDGTMDRKVYARGVGLVFDSDAELISF